MTKKNSLLLICSIFLIIEVLLSVFGLGKDLNIKFKDGFSISVDKSHSTLQDKITEDFQIDEFVKISAIIKEYELVNKKAFYSFLKNHSNPVSKIIFTNLSDKSKKFLLSNNEDKTGFHKLLVDLEIIFKEQYLFNNTISAQISPSDELTYLSSISKDKLTEMEKMRLNRISLEAVLDKNILTHQHHTPEIHGSYKLYNGMKQFFGEKSAIGTFNLLRMLLIVDLLLFFVAFSVRKVLMARPGKLQIVFEGIYSFFEELVTETLGKDRAYFTPYILTIFIFVWTSNMIGMIPIPGFMEPTRNLNVPLGLGLMAVFVVHATAIRAKGFGHHIQNYFLPWKNPLFALDLIGEVSKIVSISFRLFGNVLGGAIIILVVSSLVKYVFIPIGLNGFFGIFVGSIQAFVFTMLSLTYISVEIAE